MAVSSRLGERTANRQVGQRPISAILGKVILATLSGFALLMLTTPMLVILISAFGAGDLLRFPPESYSLEQFAKVTEADGLVESVRTSLIAAVSTVVIDILIAVPATISIVRRQFRGKNLLIGFLQSPMMIPGIVIGISILFFLSFIGMNVSIPLMTLSHVVITLPFVIRITLARMESADVALEEAARDLGATQWQVVWHILLPYIRPGIIGGSAFAFLISFNNLPTSIFTAPVLDPPLPVYLFRLMIYNVDPLVSAIAFIQIMLTFLLMWIAGRTVGLLQFVGKT